MYNYDYYKQLQGKTTVNPQGPTTSFDPQEPFTEKRSLRGGSFLCNDSYCSGYRSARRMKSSHDTGLEHTGFRCVRSKYCLLYTSDAADERSSVDLGGRRIIKKNKSDSNKVHNSSNK